MLVRILALCILALFLTGVVVKVRMTQPTVVAEASLHAKIEAATPMPDFEAFENTEEKKTAFFDFLISYVEAENNRILDTRQTVLDLRDIRRRGLDLSPTELRALRGIAREYRMDESLLPVDDLLQELVLRVDIIPSSLVLAQAANESAWGTSRFAKEGYNIFGQWCFDEGCGLIPERRQADAEHEVRAYQSVEASVRSYFRNINTNIAYSNLREMRRDMRQQGRPLDAVVLAHGLIKYSERGHVYVSELHDIIRQNGLLMLDRS